MDLSPSENTVFQQAMESIQVDSSNPSGKTVKVALQEEEESSNSSSPRL